MSKILKDIDMYGLEYKLTVRERESAQTIFGGILSLITYIGIVLSVWFLGNDIIYRTQPNTLKETILSETAPIINLNRNNYPLAFYISDIDGNIYQNETIISIYAQLEIYKYDENKTLVYNYEQLNLVKCNETHHPEVTGYSARFFEGAWCIDNQNITLQGLWSDSVSHQLAVYAVLCDFDKYPDLCASKQDIYNQLSYLSLNMIVIERALTLTNYTNPLSKYALQVVKQAVQNFTKYSYYYINNQSIVTDSGFIGSSTEIQYFMQIGFLSSDSYDRIDGYKQVVGFYISSNNISDNYIRSYVKIADLLGDIGGIFQAIAIFFSFINKPFANIEKHVAITNNMTRMQSNYHDIKKKLKFKNFIHQFKRYSNLVNYNNNNNNNNIEQLEEIEEGIVTAGRLHLKNNNKNIKEDVIIMNTEKTLNNNNKSDNKSNELIVIFNNNIDKTPNTNVNTDRLQNLNNNYIIPDFKLHPVFSSNKQRLSSLSPTTPASKRSLKSQKSLHEFEYNTEILKTKQISYWSFLNVLKCKMTNFRNAAVYEKYIKSKEEIDSNFDVSLLFNIYFQFEQMKEIVFDKEEKNIFNFLFRNKYAGTQLEMLDKVKEFMDKPNKTLMDERLSALL